MNYILGKINDFMYSYILLFMLVGTGIYFTIRLKFAQIRLLRDGVMIMKEKPVDGEESS